MEQYFICCDICRNLYCDDHYSRVCYFCENIINIIHYDKMNLDTSIFIYTDYVLKVKYKIDYDEKCIICKYKNNLMDIEENNNINININDNNKDNFITKYYPLLNIISNEDIIYDEIDTWINLNCFNLQYYIIPKTLYNDNCECSHGITYNIISAKICKKNNRIILNT